MQKLRERLTDFKDYCKEHLAFRVLFSIFIISLFILMIYLSAYNISQIQAESAFNQAQTQAMIIVSSDEATNQYIKNFLDDDKNNNNYSDFLTEYTYDFETLMAENPDTIGWITIPGTNVDYPLMQKITDNDYYLHHGFDTLPSVQGCLFLEGYNHATMTDSISVIYGHNMRNQSMFATLHYYEDEAFFQEHRYFFVYLPGKTFIYEVIAASQYTDEHILTAMLNTDYETYNESFLQKVRDFEDVNAHFIDIEPLTSEDALLVLSTCTGSNKQHRYLVIGRLIRTNE